MSGQEPDPAARRPEGACGACLRRAWLLGRLAGHLDRVRARIGALLELDDGALIAAVGGVQRDRIADEHASFEPAGARQLCGAAGVETVCRCQPGYPVGLRALAAPPAVLHLAGEPERLVDPAEVVAVVGARRASPYGIAAARSLGRGLGSAGLTVAGGMASGIDSAAHAGALDAGAPTIAVLPSAPQRAYSAASRALHARVRQGGVAVSEVGPAVSPRRWMFPARNRIIAALSAMTIVVQARSGSGALLTAACAGELGRMLGAVPGEITAPLASGPHQLIRGGAQLVRGPEDVLDALFGAGARRLVQIDRPPLAPALQGLLEALADGREAGEALGAAALDADAGLAALAALELAGRIQRGPGGRFTVL